MPLNHSGGQAPSSLVARPIWKDARSGIFCYSNPQTCMSISALASQVTEDVIVSVVGKVEVRLGMTRQDNHRMEKPLQQRKRSPQTSNNRTRIFAARGFPTCVGRCRHFDSTTIASALFFWPGQLLACQRRTKRKRDENSSAARRHSA